MTTPTTTYPQFEQRRQWWITRLHQLPAAQLAAIVERIRTAEKFDPDELDGSDTSLSGQLDEAGFGSFGPM